MTEEQRRLYPYVTVAQTEGALAGGALPAAQTPIGIVVVTIAVVVLITMTRFLGHTLNAWGQEDDLNVLAAMAGTALAGAMVAALHNGDRALVRRVVARMAGFCATGAAMTFVLALV